MSERGYTLVATLLIVTVCGAAVIAAAAGGVGEDRLFGYAFGAAVFVGVWWCIALFVRWAWHRGVPRLRAGVHRGRAGLRDWWEAGR
jgi:hypothetical protein